MLFPQRDSRLVHCYAGEMGNCKSPHGKVLCRHDTRSGWHMSCLSDRRVLGMHYKGPVRFDINVSAANQLTEISDAFAFSLDDVSVQKRLVLPSWAQSSHGDRDTVAFRFLVCGGYSWDVVIWDLEKDSSHIFRVDIPHSQRSLDDTIPSRYVAKHSGLVHTIFLALLASFTPFCVHSPFLNTVLITV
jgi:hypothetical protein